MATEVGGRGGEADRAAEWEQRAEQAVDSFWGCRLFKPSTRGHSPPGPDLSFANLSSASRHREIFLKHDNKRGRRTYLSGVINEESLGSLERGLRKVH